MTEYEKLGRAITYLSVLRIELKKIPDFSMSISDIHTRTKLVNEIIKTQSLKTKALNKCRKEMRIDMLGFMESEQLKVLE